jgi:outer membrane immunogenic protein
LRRKTNNGFCCSRGAGRVPSNGVRVGEVACVRGRHVFAAAAGLCVDAAAAADLSVAPAPIAVAPVASARGALFSWTGFYVGGHVGGGFERSSWSDPFTGAVNAFPGGAGFIGGAQAGGNLQYGRLLLGVEGDFSFTGLKGGGMDSRGNSVSANTNWTSTATGRVGAAFDRLLVYGKGGAAFARDQNSFTDLAGNATRGALMRAGWTAGIGLEYGINANWSAKVEYDYLSFGAQALNFTTPTTPSYSTNAGLNIQQIKAGLNFRFGGP